MKIDALTEEIINFVKYVIRLKFLQYQIKYKQKKQDRLKRKMTLLTLTYVLT